ncbi:GDSL esterase/lipase At5g45950 [Malania oleifera]|uniref:GDSL esterase/lipase At5g45950 n=1 Tax=Malania oleifera TaxID=397392 RepID=UPI0025AE0756|nr:GDSL esterase/lipase At5g45950 [Malania oleifera]
MERLMTMRLITYLMQLLAAGLLVPSPWETASAVDIPRLRQLAARNNVTSILVFGDSSVDPGNNNNLATTFKANFPPYGVDFFSGRPTGRFTNGRLVTDFVAEALGYANQIPGFLDRRAKKTDKLHGVSFASAASGYDDLTANLSNVVPVWKQLEYLREYKMEVGRMVGRKKAEEMTGNAVFVMSMGTNDFIQNYYSEPTHRPKQFSLEQYQHYLVSCMARDIKKMQWQGARRVAVVGVPPLGCMPLARTLRDETGCVESYNAVAFSFNSKVKNMLASLTHSLHIKTAFVDAYAIIQAAINKPHLYGFAETSKGCCGSGTIEFGEMCKDLTTCSNRSAYLFWDAVHPTEKMYKIIADEVLNSIAESLLL